MDNKKKSQDQSDVILSPDVTSGRRISDRDSSPPKSAVQNDKGLETEIAKLKEELLKKNNLYLRALADYENLTRRLGNERAAFADNIYRSIFLELTFLKDDMDKAEEFEKVPSLKLIKQKFEALFKKFGLEEIIVLGKEYNPETAECVEVVQGKANNQVIKVHEKGYKFQGRLLKPARVTVTKI